MRQWYAVKSKPRRESFVEQLLERANLEVFLPRIGRRGRAMELEPLFPGYLFARLDPMLGDVQTVRYTYGVAHLVGFGGEPAVVPDALIAAIRQRVATRQLAITFGKGERVVITSGPFKDVEAIFDRRLSAEGRVQVLIRIVERFCRAEMHVGQLRRAS